MDEAIRAIRAQESLADEVYDAFYQTDESDDPTDWFAYAMLDIA